jgi:thiamine biosynthesis lipoprotein
VGIRNKTFEAIGTLWELQVYDKVTEITWAELLERITARIESFDKAYSRFRADSLVTRVSQAAGTSELPEDGYTLLQFYEKLYNATDGKVTPLIGQALADAGYDAHYSLLEKTVQTPPRWEGTLSYTKATITLQQPALLDFGSAGKGYLVDIIGDLLEQAGMRNYTINAGGDIRHRTDSHTALDVGLENPLDTTEAVGIVSIGNQSLCASAGSKRKWGNFHHIIDPDSLESPQDILATWVLADDTMTADGLATALFFTSAEELNKTFSFSYAVLGKDMGLVYSKDFPVTVFEAA